MIKQTEVLIRTGEGKFIPIGTAELELDFEFDSFSKSDILNNATLNKLKINVKKGDIIWERSQNSYK